MSYPYQPPHPDPGPHGEAANKTPQHQPPAGDAIVSFAGSRSGLYELAIALETRLQGLNDDAPGRADLVRFHRDVRAALRDVLCPT